MLVDEHYQPIKECAGLIKPNRMELPACGAILVNQLSIQRCMNDGQRECDAAITIHQFLQQCTQDHGHVPLVGFNSARFDFKHVEKLLLKHGLSPTFYGKITSLDIYQYSKYCALTEPDKFPLSNIKKAIPTATVFDWKTWPRPLTALIRRKPTMPKMMYCSPYRSPKRWKPHVQHHFSNSKPTNTILTPLIPQI